jgi:hypothetical protein
VSDPDQGITLPFLPGDHVTGIVRDPVIAWRDERLPLAPPSPDPPRSGPFSVTRSEIVTRASGVVVHIWYSYEQGDRS